METIMERMCSDNTTSSIHTSTNNRGSTLVRIRRFLLFWLLAFSFGGFLFYASVVVPIGSTVLGTTTQGFVTRLVTNAINASVAVFLVALTWEIWAGRADRARLAQRWLVLLTLWVAVCLLVLVVLHPKLELLLVPETLEVTQVQRFYALHRVYLWVSTLQWLCSLPISWILLSPIPFQK